MNNSPASQRLNGLADQCSTATAPALPQRSRAFWFVLGFFTSATVAGFIAGIFK